MHIKETVSLQQHLEIGFPDATIVVLETAAGGAVAVIDAVPGLRSGLKHGEMHA